MKPTAWLINVSRGPIVDESAVISALENNRLGAAALDVFIEEPLPDDSPLYALPNLQLSPHIAGITKESHYRIGEIVVEQALALLAGQLPQHLVNSEATPKIQERLTRLLACP